MTLPAILFALATFSTIFCTAVNCYTFRLAYPLWRAVPPADFPALHREYLRLLTPVITLPHILMFFSSALLLRWRPALFHLPEAVILFALNTAVIAISAFMAGPIHTRFTQTGTPDQPGLTRLIQISAVRSALMLAASALLCYTLVLTIR